MGTFEVSSRFMGDPRVMIARVTGGPETLGVWVACLMWRSANRNSPDSIAGKVPPIWFLPESVAKIELGRRRKPLTALLKNGLWERHTWEGVKGYKILAEKDLWRIKRRAPGVYKRPLISQLVRDSIYARDGFKCLHCNTTERLSLDHIYPYSLGGTDDPGNLQTLCVSCNSRKGVSA